MPGHHRARHRARVRKAPPPTRCTRRWDRCTQGVPPQWPMPPFAAASGSGRPALNRCPSRLRPRSASRRCRVGARASTTAEPAESASFGAEAGAGAWQAGLVASVTRTELHYRAEAALAERGYRTGEHDTELLSLHPFAAWHAPSGGHFWGSLGAGVGSLRHRDDLGFRSWSRSDVRLSAYAAGASFPVAEVLSGELRGRRPASSPSRSTSRVAVGFPRRCPHFAGATIAPAWRGVRRSPAHLPSRSPTSA